MPDGNALPLPPDVPLTDDGEKFDRICNAADRSALLDIQRWDKYVKQFRDGRWNVAPGSESDMVSMNSTFSSTLAFMAFLYAQSPGLEVEPRDGAGSGSDRHFAPLIQMGVYADAEEARRDFADAVEQALQHSYEKSRTNIHNLAALFKARLTGMGITKESYDPASGLDRSDCLGRHEVYFDPHARFDVPQCFYVVQLCEMQIERAREFFEAKGVNPRALEPNYRLEHGEGLSGEKAKENPPPGSENDIFKFYEIWWKDGDRRRLDYRFWRDPRWILRGDWPFQLDRDDFPFSTLIFHQQFTALSDAFSERHVVNALAKAADKTMEAYHRSVLRSIAKKLGLDADVFDDAASNQMLDAKDMRAVRVKLEGKRWEDVAHLFEFNSKTDVTLELARTFKDAEDEITGLHQLKQNLTSTDMTATQADIIEKQGQAGIGRDQRVLDEFLTVQCRHRAMIARQLLAPERVAEIAGLKAGLVWSVWAGNPEDLTSEFSIGIAAGSTGERATQQKIGVLERELDRAMRINSAYAAPVYNLIEYSKEIARLNKIRRPQRFMNEAVVQQILNPQPMLAPAPGQPGLPAAPAPGPMEAPRA